MRTPTTRTHLSNKAFFFCCWVLSGSMGVFGVLCNIVGSCRLSLMVLLDMVVSFSLFWFVASGTLKEGFVKSEEGLLSAASAKR